MRKGGRRERRDPFHQRSWAMSAISVTPSNKLPVGQTVGAAYAIWFKNLPELIRIAWLWLLIMAPIVFALNWWEQPYMAETMQNARNGLGDPHPGWTLLVTFINGIIVM